MEWLVTNGEDGMMTRDFIASHIRLSTKMLKYLKYRNDGILVNGEKCTVRRILRTGDVLTLAIEDRRDAEMLEPVELPIEILFEDDWLVVPSKPPQMPTHPSHDHHRDTLANALAFRYRQMGVPFVFRPVNRLDRDTSGLLLIARNKMAAGLLTRALQEGRIRKTYLAVLKGALSEDAGVIERPLHRTAASIIVREVCSPDAPDAEQARTEFRVLLRSPDYTLVEAHPITGRTHQLRVHFASLGHPIVGDDLYGEPHPLMPRQALHAYELTFPHPVTDQTMTLRAPLPEDLQELLKTAFPSSFSESETDL